MRLYRTVRMILKCLSTPVYRSIDRSYLSPQVGV